MKVKLMFKAEGKVVDPPQGVPQPDASDKTTERDAPAVKVEGEVTDG